MLIFGSQHNSFFSRQNNGGMSGQIINDNEFNAELKRRNSEEQFDQDAKPKRSSFKNSDSFVRTHSGTFVRMDSDNFTRNLSGGQQMSPDQSRSGTNGTTGTTGMPDFRGIKNLVKLISQVFWLEIKKSTLSHS